MRAITVAVVAILAVALALVSAAVSPAAHRAPAACAPAHHRVVKRGAEVLIFESGYEPFACLRPHGRPLAVMGPDDDDGEYNSPGTLFLAGHFIAYADFRDNGCGKYDQCPPGDTGISATITLLDVKAHRRHVADDTTDVGALVVCRCGAAAFVDGRRLRVLSAGGRVTTRDAGPVEPRSLKLSGTTLTYTVGGAPRTAALGAS